MAQTFNTNLQNVVWEYAKALNIKVTKTTIKRLLLNNPFYPSLYSISDTFEKINVENKSFKFDVENLNQLPLPFIAYKRNETNENDFVTVTNLNENDVTFISDKKRTISLDKFKKDFSEYIFLAETNLNSGEANYLENLKKEKSQKLQTTLMSIMGLLVVFCACFYFVYAAVNTLAALLIILLVTSGLTITTMLLVYEVDKSNSFIKDICTAGKKSNCDAVLNSKAAKILGTNWSELGFFYFASIFLFLIIPFGSFSFKLPIIAIISSLSAFYIPFSIYYQYKVIKDWCPLCLAVQLILGLGLLWSIFSFWMKPMLLNYDYLIPFVIISIIPILTWFILKPIIAKSIEAPLLEAAHTRLLHNPDIFRAQLMQQIKVKDGWENIGITLGNPNATNTIIKVCNPFCGPCAKAHEVLEEVLKSNKDYKLKIIFFVSNEEGYEESKAVVEYFLNVRDSNIIDLDKVVHFWYSLKQKKYQFLLDSKIEKTTIKKYNEEIDAMYSWCKDSNISFTPTIFVNGYQLPEFYKVEDIPSVI